MICSARLAGEAISQSGLLTRIIEWNPGIKLTRKPRGLHPFSICESP